MGIVKNFKLENIEKIFGWIIKAKKVFEPFKPELREMRINYRTQNSEISMSLNIPASIRRAIAHVEIPAYQNFRVSGMIDESFSKVESGWQFIEGKWVLKPLTLPASERFLVKLEGEVPEQVLKDIVRIQPAKNRDQTSDVDRYWLHSMIRDAGFFEDIYKELEITDVNLAAHVGIERCFSTTFPEEMKTVLRASQRWTRAGYGRDRGEIQRAWRNLRQVTSTSKVKVGDIINEIYALTLGQLFAEYLAVDIPYSLGDIKREEKFLGLFPEKMSVEACTDLNLKNPVAKGFLDFKKSQYMKRIEESLSKIKK